MTAQELIHHLSALPPRTPILINSKESEAHVNVVTFGKFQSANTGKAPRFYSIVATHPKTYDDLVAWHCAMLSD